MKKLSIIVVTFNASFDLERTLESVIQQTFTDYEVVIIDGKSTDNTLEIIKHFEDRIDYCVSEKDGGIYDAMNKGINAATGEYLQFLNAGDYLVDKDVLSRVFNDHPENTTLLYGDINVLHTNGKVTRQAASDFKLDELLARGTSVLCHQAMFVLRKSAPFYDTKYKFKGELNWYFDLVEQEGFTFKKQDTIVVAYSLGGWGHKHFVRNRLDWLRLIYDRYGIKTMRQYKIVSFLWHNSFYRYPWLGKLNGFMTSPVSFFKK